MKRSLQIRLSMALLAAAALLITGVAAGLGLSFLTGYPAEGPFHGVPVYVAQNSAVMKVGASNQPGFATILKPALPAVVSITSSRIVKAPHSPLFNDPSFRRFFGERLPQQQRETGLGSGVIISPDGYILTNNHVVEKGTTIKVMLADRREFPGKVIGTDPKTDIAVVKIDATGLPTIAFGDSTRLTVGDYAFAIGTPSVWEKRQPWASSAQPVATGST